MTGMERSAAPNGGSGGAEYDTHRGPGFEETVRPLNAQAHAWIYSPSTRVRLHSLGGRSQGGRSQGSPCLSLKEESVVYSHIWDLLLKIALMVGLVVLSQSLHAEEWLRGIGVPVGYSVPTLIAIIAVAWMAISRQVLSTIGAWLYARLSLGADVSLNEARQLARLFQLDLSFRWVPLKEIKQLPRTERRNALLAKLEALGPGRRSMLL